MGCCQGMMEGAVIWFPGWVVVADGMWTQDRLCAGKQLHSSMNLRGSRNHAVGWGLYMGRLEKQGECDKDMASDFRSPDGNRPR